MSDCALTAEGFCLICDPKGDRLCRPGTRRNCRPEDPRPEAEQRLLAATCATCDRLGEIGLQENHDEKTTMHPICGLDLPSANRRKLADQDACAKRFLRDAYRRRLSQRGGECEPWKEALRMARSAS